MTSGHFPETARPVTVGAMEDAHARDAAGLDYGDECVLTLTNGRQLRTDTYEAFPAGATYVRVLDKDGNEVAYWDSAEWAEEPMQVMGAIFGAAKGES